MVFLRKPWGLFTIRLGKAVIWNFPSQFVVWKTGYPDGGNHYSYSVRDPNGILRDYLDTPKDGLLKNEFALDYFGMANILKSANRRLGLERLQERFNYCEHETVVKVLSVRFALQYG